MQNPSRQWLSEVHSFYSSEIMEWGGTKAIVAQQVAQACSWLGSKLGNNKSHQHCSTLESQYAKLHLLIPFFTTNKRYIVVEIKP
jgi:hypothetical protein